MHVITCLYFSFVVHRTRYPAFPLSFRAYPLIIEYCWLRRDTGVKLQDGCLHRRGGWGWLISYSRARRPMRAQRSCNTPGNQQLYEQCFSLRLNLDNFFNRFQRRTQYWLINRTSQRLIYTTDGTIFSADKGRLYSVYSPAEMVQPFYWKHAYTFTNKSPMVTPIATNFL